MKDIKLSLAAAVGTLIVFVGGAALGAGLTINKPHKATKIEQAKAFAVRVDNLIDKMEAPEFNPEDLWPYWAYEVSPFFSYEGLTYDNEYQPPVLNWIPLLAGAEHNHLLGFTYCQGEIFLNIRVVNPVSSWYKWERNPLATLVHEMVHTLGGGFCTTDSAITESNTQTGTLEVLAALANQKNTAAMYSLLFELKDSAMDVVLADALKRKDLDSYREWRRILEPSALEEARFEKSMRFWASDMPFLQEILNKYSVRVYNNMLRGKVTMDIPPIALDGMEVLKLNDLTYFLKHMEAMVEDGQG